MVHIEKKYPQKLKAKTSKPTTTETEIGNSQVVSG